MFDIFTFRSARADEREGEGEREKERERVGVEEGERGRSRLVLFCVVLVCPRVSSFTRYALLSIERATKRATKRGVSNCN